MGGFFPPLIFSKMGTVIENLFSGSVHIYSFGDAKETLSSVEKQSDPGFECENGRDQNRGGIERQTKSWVEASAVPYGLADSSLILPDLY